MSQHSTAAQSMDSRGPTGQEGELRIILLGPPGAGKGTQAKRLTAALGIPAVASGDLFRDQQQRGTELGLLAKSYMERGALVPDEVTIRMVLERLSQPNSAKGFLLDGFPRNLDQARALRDSLSESGTDINRVFFIKISEEEMLRRLGGRLICRNCQASYHNLYSPPKEADKCDRCGGELYQRPDDSQEAVRKRIMVYNEETAPLVEYYRQAGNLLEINGEGTIEEVAQALVEEARRIGWLSSLTDRIKVE